MNHTRLLSRRIVLRGLGGLAISLPILESLWPRTSQAQDPLPDTFAIFFRQANGVACAQTTSAGKEPERFWPQEPGALSADSLKDRALAELEAWRDKLLVVGRVNMQYFDYGDGHATGALQGLTARGPTVKAAGGDSQADGESIDNFIGRKLNADGRDSLFLYSGVNNGWLGGACISYRESGKRRAALHSPIEAFKLLMGVNPDVDSLLIARQKSINDLVREQFKALMSRPRLSADDKKRLELHLESIRDLEKSLGCQFSAEEQATVEGLGGGFDSDDGAKVLAAARAHMHIAALAVACGYTRSVAIQVGNGNDGNTRYPDPDTGSLMADNYHYISHRMKSHGSKGDAIPNADLLHHKIDRQFAQTFGYLLEKLSAYEMPGGKTLLDAGIAAWYNDNANGPAHDVRGVPWILAGGAHGFLKQGQYIALPSEQGGDDISRVNHPKLLNTIASAVGVRKDDGSMLDDFGDPTLPKGILSEILA